MAKSLATKKTLLAVFHNHPPLNQWKRRLLPLFLTLLLCGLNSLPFQIAQATPALQPDRIKVSPKVPQALQQQDTVPVIVSLVDPVAITAASSLRVQQVQQVSNAVLSRVSAVDFRPYRRFSHVPAIAGQANARAIAALEANPQVAFIQIDEAVQAHLAQSVPAIGADVVHNNYNLTGQNVRVAVLDTGIDTDHPDLADSLIAQHCFSLGATMTGDCLPGRTKESTSAEDENGHGSNVSGIITSNGVVSSIGFAPSAQIVAIRVLDAQGLGFVSDWISGLDWIIANQSTLHVKIINMSLGTFTLFAGNCDAEQPFTSNALAQIHNLGITVFASSGNQGATTTIASPACNSNMVAVGATYDSNVGRQPPNPYANYQAFINPSWPACFNLTTSLQTITCFTNSGSALDIIAPGAPITSDYLNGGLAMFYGTSQASPTAAGVAALMLQAAPNLTPNQIEATLKSTGTLITDTRNGLQFPLINALAAVQAFTPQPPTLLSPGDSSTVANSFPTFMWNTSTYATKYEMRLEQHDPPTVLVFSGNATSFRPTKPLIVGTYYWQVRALNGLLASPWSTPAQAVIIESSSGAMPLRNYFTTSKPTLTWNRITDAIRYEVQVADNNLFSGATTQNAGNNLAITWPIALTDGVYYWRVRACKTAAPSSCSLWSAYDSFVVDVP
jgi:subtilisin family serine protease